MFRIAVPQQNGCCFTPALSQSQTDIIEPRRQWKRSFISVIAPCRHGCQSRCKHEDMQLHHNSNAPFHFFSCMTPAQVCVHDQSSACCTHGTGARCSMSDPTQRDASQQKLWPCSQYQLPLLGDLGPTWPPRADWSPQERLLAHICSNQHCQAGSRDGSCLQLGVIGAYISKNRMLLVLTLLESHVAKV